MPRYVDEMITRFLTEGLDSAVGAFDKMAAGSGKYSTHFKAAMEYALPRMGQWGDSARMMAGQWITAYREGEKMDNMLASLATSQGVSAKAAGDLKDQTESLAAQTGISHDEIAAAAVAMMNWKVPADEIAKLLPYLARQALTTQQPIEGIGNAVGKAFSSGNVGMLKRSRISIDDTTMAFFKAKLSTVNWADATQVASLRAMVLSGTMKGIDETAVPLGSNLKTLDGRMKVMAERWDLAQESLGEGAAKANEYKRELAGLFLTLGAGHPELTKFAGGVWQIGGDVLKLVGAVGQWGHGTLEIVRFMKMSKDATAAASLAKKGLTVATKADSAAELAKVGIAKNEATALLGTADAAKAATAAKGGLANVMGGTRGGGKPGLGDVPGGPMGYKGLVPGPLGKIAAGLGGVAAGHYAAELAGSGGWKAAGAGAGAVVAGAGAGYAVAGPAGAVIGGAGGFGSGLYTMGKETHALNEQAKKDRAEFGKAGEAAPGFAAMQARSRARVTRTGGDIQVQFTVRGAGYGNQQIRDYKNLRD